MFIERGKSVRELLSKIRKFSLGWAGIIVLDPSPPKKKQPASEN